MESVHSTMLTFPSVPDGSLLITLENITVPRTLLDSAMDRADTLKAVHYVGQLWIPTGQMDISKWSYRDLTLHFAGVARGEHSLNSEHRYLNSWLCSTDHALMKQLCGSWLWVPPLHVRLRDGYPYQRSAVSV